MVSVGDVSVDGLGGAEPSVAAGGGTAPADDTLESSAAAATAADRLTGSCGGTEATASLKAGEVAALWASAGAPLVAARSAKIRAGTRPVLRFMRSADQFLNEPVALIWPELVPEIVLPLIEFESPLIWL